tara:strand:- start:441 stop:653 length:213 start_codon:yes stop_codon:yes gene_type:complete
MSQSDRVLEYLQRGKTITTLDAYSELGITRLAARVWELKQKGYPVKSTVLKVINRFGEKCSVSEYCLEGE